VTDPLRRSRRGPQNASQRADQTDEVPSIASRGVTIEVIHGIEIDLDELHDDLAELKSLIRRWARSDAIERDTTVRAASTEDLTAL
jgi:hypothetical protein